MIVIDPLRVELSSERAVHDVMIFTDSKSAVNEIPRGHDAVSIRIDEVPEGLETFEVHVGGFRFHSFDAAYLRCTVSDNLLPDVLPFSKSTYMITKLVFRFGTDYLKRHETTEMVDEVTEKIEYGDEPMEIFDGHEYHVGLKTTRRIVETGHKIPEIVKGVGVRIPRIEIETVENHDDPESRAVVPLWQRIRFDPKADAEYMRRISGKHEMRTLDMAEVYDIEGAIRKGEPFWCMIKNFGQFSRGMAGVMYVF